MPSRKRLSGETARCLYFFMKPLNKKTLTLLLLLGCAVVFVQILVSTFILRGPPLPDEADATYFKLANFSLSHGYYFLVKNVSNPRSLCRSQCDKLGDPCQAYAVSGNGALGHCYRFSKGPLEYGLQPEPQPGTDLFVKNIKPDEVLQNDKSAYYTVTTLTNYTAATETCNQSFYHIAMDMPGNNALRMAKTYYKRLLIYSNNETYGIGFFVDVYEKVKTNFNLSTSKTYVKIGDDLGDTYLKRLVYYDGQEKEISPTSNIMGYPLCQGTPFNLLNESMFLSAEPVVEAVVTLEPRLQIKPRDNEDRDKRNLCNE